MAGADLKRTIDRNFGTYRGLIRLALSYGQVASGRAGRCLRLDWRNIQRLVFVCQGNICRSAYAEHYTRRLGLRTASFGLATTPGLPAEPTVLAIARQRGIDMEQHRTKTLDQFQIRPGDLFLAMEVRQVHRLKELFSERQEPQITLLGLWARPPRPHIHDPFTLSTPYFETCIGVIERSISSLANQLARRRVTGPSQ